MIRTKQTYQLTGRQLNGLSQACSYGDDATMATNYPIVRVRSAVDGKEYYGKTFDHSTMAIATGSNVVTTSFKLPFGVPSGPADLVVIANGISSEPVDITVIHWRLFFPFTDALVNRLIGSLADGPLWVLGPNGPVPVDPGWGQMDKDARDAWARLTEAAKTLMVLGAEADKRQRAAVEPPQPLMKKKPTTARR